MQLVGYSIQPGSGNALQRLIIKYTIWIQNPSGNYEEEDDE